MKFDVIRSITINAPLSTVRTLVEDFAHWNRWSPWVVLEPECKVTVEGEVNTPGHVMRWEGNVIGSGQNTINSSTPEQIDYDLEFFKPWKSKAKVSFIFEQVGEQVKATWTMHSNMPFFLFFMIKTTQNYIGMDYDRGLKMLKEIAEKGQLACETINAGTTHYEGFSYVGIKRTVAIKDMPSTMAKDFEKIVNDIVITGSKSAKNWICVYPKFDINKGLATYIAAVSDEDLGELNLDPSYENGQIHSGTVLEIKHNGAYEFLGNAWSMGMMHARADKLKCKGHPFEQYWNSPFEVAPQELKTSVYLPLKN